MCAPAVEFDDQALGRPVHVDLIAVEMHIGLRGGEAGALDELSQASLHARAGHAGAVLDERSKLREGADLLVRCEAENERLVVGALDVVFEVGECLGG
jgi:hypothetical protein